MMLSQNSADKTPNPCNHCGLPKLPHHYTLLGEQRVIYFPQCNCEKELREQEKKAKVLSYRKKMLRQAGFDLPLYKGMTLESWEKNGCEALYDRFVGSLYGFRNWCFLFGDYGLGKTHMAVAMARSVTLCFGMRPCILRWAEYCSKTQASWSDKEIRPDWMAGGDADILVIDDLDKRALTRWSMEKLYEVIDYRYVYDKPLILTANRSLRQLRLLWKGELKDAGAAVLSRIAAKICEAREFRGIDYRLRDI